ncbi:collagen-like repeat preface domain-containing protein, partial [Vibrio parahaemolyticus]|nr:collagen-like repeat preface domain-containing protein [Vibrio parahaemolyticus]
AAPGVGKSYKMLYDAREMKKDGMDIVIGLIETHGRKETEEAIADLEKVPLKEIQYKGKVFYGNDCCEVRACSHINISKSELTEFVRLLQALGQAIQAVFQNPSQTNIDNLIAALNNLQKFLNCLDLSPAQKQIGNSIIANLLTILRTTPFSCGALYVELQSLLNYLLYIAKLFKV